MKARPHARYQLYRKASLKCVFLEKAWRNGGSASTQGMAETRAKFAQREDLGLASGFFDSVFSLGRHLYVVSYLTSSFRARRFEELDSIVMDAVGAVKMDGFGGGGCFDCRPDPRSCLLL